ncbi:MGMT family protein [Gilvimarinus algae]|uniref:MGMT family protein n=1 Tax=Gilvimarinus algae TaxID=3058037 RepID=A0ABT8TCQ9_9GAMM|nr:MGMT family protein [Gilvimarinus sp. SDUM040014]MDO3381875.1 MGMT family protein [Gilvimarinus sp. SDUM040014]
MPENNHRTALYTALAQVPPGRVLTYGQLARLAGRPGAARWAGSVLRQLPEHSQLPWHRVLNAAGRLSLGPGSAGQLQRQRLQDEGVIFTGERVDLTIYGWPPQAV